MKNIKSCIKKVVRLLLPPLVTNYFWTSSYERELRRIRSNPRFEEGFSQILGKKIKYTDSASFCFIFDEIFRKKIYQFTSQSEQPYIIDAGANIGLSIIYFKSLYPHAEITAFEPDEEAYSALQYNIESFDLTNVKLVKKGLWDSNTSLKFYAEGADGGRIATPSNDSQIVDIKTERLTSYLNRRVDFLKMDIEGAEVRVMKDCEAYLTSVENIFVEYHSFTNQSQQLHEILQILSGAGFQYVIHHVGVFSQQPFTTVNQYMDMDLQLNIYGYRL